MGAMAGRVAPSPWLCCMVSVSRKPIIYHFVPKSVQNRFSRSEKVDTECRYAPHRMPGAVFAPLHPFLGTGDTTSITSARAGRNSVCVDV